MYDSRDQLREVLRDRSIFEVYQYDAQGRRVRKTSTDGIVRQPRCSLAESGAALGRRRSGEPTTSRISRMDHLLRDWAAECPAMRATRTTPPNTCEGGIGVACATLNVPIPMSPLRQQ